MQFCFSSSAFRLLLCQSFPKPAEFLRYLFSHPTTMIVHRVIFFSAVDHLGSVFSAFVEIRHSLDSLF